MKKINDIKEKKYNEIFNNLKEDYKKNIENIKKTYDYILQKKKKMKINI